jgi:hypothetical protein
VQNSPGCEGLLSATKLPTDFFQTSLTQVYFGGPSVCYFNVIDTQTISSGEKMIFLAT